MGNVILYSWKGISKQLAACESGVDKHLVDIIMKQNTKDAIHGTRVLLDGEPAGPGGVPPMKLGAKEQYDADKAAKVVATAAKRAARLNGYNLGVACAAALRNTLGRRWNSKWNAVGFTNHSLKVSTDPTGPLTGIGNYYKRNPSAEAADVNGVACTGAACFAALDAIETADSNSKTANVAAKASKATLEQALEAARHRLIGVKTELGQLLADDDPRYEDFGFRMPADTASPDVPENLVVTLAGAGVVLSEWDDSVRADSFRAVIKDAAGNELVNKIVWDSEFTAHRLTSGITITVEISARNATGESEACTPVTVIVG